MLEGIANNRRAGLQPAVARKPTRKGKVDGDCTLIATFTRDQILKHLAGLRDDFNAGVTAQSVRSECFGADATSR